MRARIVRRRRRRVTLSRGASSECDATCRRRWAIVCARRVCPPPPHRRRRKRRGTASERAPHAASVPWTMYIDYLDYFLPFSRDAGIIHEWLISIAICVCAAGASGDIFWSGAGFRQQHWAVESSMGGERKCVVSISQLPRPLLIDSLLLFCTVVLIFAPCCVWN